MGRRLLLTLVLVLAGACGSSPAEHRSEPSSAGAEEGPSAGAGSHLSPSSAEETARRAAEQEGYAVDEYRVTSTTQEGDEYTFSFERPDPTPPGGHFDVVVNARSGEARVVPGE